MNKTLLVAKHEFFATAANKAFVVITLLGPFLILAVSVLPGLAAKSGAGSAGSVVAVVGAQAPLELALSASLAEVKSRLEVVGDEAAAAAGIESGRYAAALVLGPGAGAAGGDILYTKTGTDYALYARIEGVYGALSRQARAAASGVDPALLAKILEGPGLEIRKLGKEGAEGPVKGSGNGVDAYVGILMTVLAFVMLMYMTILLYGQLIGRSVIQEKSSKTVEIMLSTVSSRQLLVGKILGPGLAGIIQYAVWIGLGLAGISLAGPALGVSIPQSLSAANLLWLIAFFVPAYFLYASLYAALGAGAEDEQNLAQLAWPILIFLMIPMVMINLFVSSPDSAVSVILSYFPLTSPIVMLIRVLVSPPAPWEIGLSYAILLASIWAAARIAAKVFRIGILMTGKKRKLGEIVTWAFVK
jgi:ABC-2 type transport system permease protein